MPPLIITLVRHAESKDNVTALWAGHRDAPLTNHGFNQSMRLAQHFEEVPITAIYTSDLKRAQTTARNVASLNKSRPPPPVTVSPLLREQFFGEAEGAPWNEGLYSSTHLPWEDHRAFRLAPFAESLNDVSSRADQVLRHFVLPHLVASHHSSESHHIVLFAHGIWLSEMRFALARAQDPKVRFVKSSGYHNTAWSRFEVELVGDGEEVEGLEDEVPLSTTNRGSGSGPAVMGQTTTEAVPNGAKEEHAPMKGSGTNGEELTGMSEPIRALLPTLPDLPDRHPALPPPFLEGKDVPRLRFKVMATNQAEHLEGLKRTGGGVGSSEHDEKQRGLKEFFGGGGGTAKS